MNDFIPYIAGAIGLIAVAWFLHGHLAQIKSKLGIGSSIPATHTPAPVPQPVTVTVNAGNSSSAPPTAPEPVSTPVQPLPAGLSWADTTLGTVNIPSIASKFAPGTVFLTTLALPCVASASAAAFSIAANCHNIWLLGGISGMGAAQPWTSYRCPVTAANPAGSALPYHLFGQLPGETPPQNIPNAVAIPSTFTTLAQIEAHCATLPVYGTTGVSPVAAP